MAVTTNTTVASDVCTALDVEFVGNFRQDYDRLAEVFQIVSGPEVRAAGSALYQYKVTGALNAAEYTEGDEVPLSKYTVEKVPLGDLTPHPYRKQTTAQAILKGGFENAVLKTDRKMLSDCRHGIVGDFFSLLENGSSSVYADDLQAVLPQCAAKLSDLMETNHDSNDSTVVYFANPFDIAGYLGGASVTTQTVFGLTYLKDFMGVESLVESNRVPRGTVVATPVDNIHAYGIDFGSLGDAGITYSTESYGLIGVSHEPVYNRVSAATNVLVGAKFVPEVLDYIVVSCFGDLNEDWDVPQLKAFADAKGIDIGNKTTKPTILAAIQAALA